MTLFLTTHYLDEAQRLSDRILIIAAGKIVAEGSPEDIGGRESAPGTIHFALPAGLSTVDLPPLPPDATVDMVEDQVSITARDLVAATHAITGWSLERSLELAGFRVERRTLEDTYLSIIGETDTGGAP
jgi:ABC-2 type transport system ATP-binding protein